MSKEMEYRERMASGDIYDPNDRALMLEQERHIQWVNRFNRTNATLFGLLRRQRLMKKMFAAIGENCYIEPPFHSNWGASHVHFGKGVYANFNLTLVDDTDIYVGDYTLFGPNVTLCTAAHPLHPDVRKEGLQYNKPIHIGSHCWFGSNVIVLPGVTIGNNVVVGAGSLVTKDIPDNALAYGSPARKIRDIGEEDRHTYDHGRPVQAK